MNQAPHPYRRELETRYTFVSEGKRPIMKVVEFFLTCEEDLYSLGFGDQMEDGTVDDTTISNNEDIIKVIATVFKIAERFTDEFPDAEIYFTGSNCPRTRLYNRIIKTNYPELKKKFRITGSKRSGDGLIEEVYNYNSGCEYVVFSLKRLN